MLKLAAIIYLLVGPTLAGTAVLVALAAPELGLAGMKGVTTAGLGGLIAGIPVSFIVAGMLNKKTKA